MAAYTGVGSRIREQMVKLGYVRSDGEPDVQRFSWDFRYDRTLIYAWLSDKATPFKDLIRLTRDLQVTAEWLLVGTESTGKPRRPTAARGVQPAEKPLSVEAASRLKKKHTKRSVSARKDGRGATLC